MTTIEFEGAPPLSRDTADLAGRILDALDHVDEKDMAPVVAGLKSVPDGGGKRILDYWAGVTPETERLWQETQPRPYEVVFFLARQAGWQDPDRLALPLNGYAAGAVRLAIYALASHPRIFTFGGKLVEVVGNSIRVIEKARLRSLVSDAVWISKGKGEGQCLAPPWLLESILAEPEYPRIPELVGVVESPSLRPDGSILSRPGYDPSTRLYYRPNAEFGEVADEPTLDDALDAAADLLAVVADFPFEDESDRAAGLAALLTPLARLAVKGPTPVPVITANAAGTGKGLMMEVIATIVTGGPAPTQNYTTNDAEMDKVLTSIAIAGSPLVCFDNVGDGVPFGGPSLDRALTTMIWQGRVLGSSEIVVLPFNVCLYATGNNVRVCGDTVRRTVPIRLRTDLEHPEERTGFKIPDLPAYVREHRPRLVVAALTILRAHALAGRPNGTETSFGSYESWSRVVRAAVHWVLGVDPCSTRSGIRAEDPEAEGRLALLRAWSELPGGRTGITAAKALAKAKAGEAPALAALLQSGETAASLGYRLRAIRNRVTDRLVFRADPDRTRTLEWRVEPADDAGVSQESPAS